MNDSVVGVALETQSLSRVIKNKQKILFLKQIFPSRLFCMYKVQAFEFKSTFVKVQSQNVGDQFVE